MYLLAFWAQDEGEMEFPLDMITFSLLLPDYANYAKIVKTLRMHACIV
jgi:hypothetical protein